MPDRAIDPPLIGGWGVRPSGEEEDDLGRGILGILCYGLFLSYLKFETGSGY